VSSSPLPSLRGSWPLGISISALGLGLLVAQNCDAADWQQALMLLAAPPIAGAGAGLMVIWASPRYRVPIAVGVALLVAAATLLAVIFVWGGECSR
jgi:peptidoglycan/LPS O-acetylase OafA/YrhL